MPGGPCDTCGGLPCSCGRRRRACDACQRVFCICDKAADMWAREHGERLPHQDDTGRLFGGHLHDTDPDRGDPQQRLQALLQGQGAELQRVGETVEASAPRGNHWRHTRDAVVARLEAIRLFRHSLDEEERRLARHKQILDLLYDGEGLLPAEIGRVFGYGRTWAMDRITEMRRDLGERQERTRLTIRCGFCGAEAPPTLGCGRPKRWCKPNCRKRASDEKRAGRNSDDIPQPGTDSETPGEDDGLAW